MIRVESRGLSALVGRLEELSKNFPRDIKRTVLDSKRRIKADASRSATAVYNIGRNDIANRWEVFDDGEFAFRIFASRRPIVATAYGAKLVVVSRKVGNTKVASTAVSAKFLKDGRAGRIPRSWWAPSPTKRSTILPWQRTGASRYPITPIFGPSLANILRNPKVSEPLVKVAVKRMAEQLTQRISRAIHNG